MVSNKMKYLENNPWEPILSKEVALTKINYSFSSQKL
jgi:hypothetical protein